jgi:hypothetical protein
VAKVAAKTGEPFAQVLELVRAAERETLERFVTMVDKRREATAGHRVASLAPEPGNRALRRQAAAQPRPRKARRRGGRK